MNTPSCRNNIFLPALLCIMLSSLSAQDMSINLPGVVLTGVEFDITVNTAADAHNHFLLNIDGHNISPTSIEPGVIQFENLSVGRSGIVQVELLRDSGAIALAETL